MEIDGLPILGNTVDKSQVPPIHQKRILAFVNHFITTTCSFLNDFALNCENKFINLERKIQRVEASLIIIESKIASIPSLEKPETVTRKEDAEIQIPVDTHDPPPTTTPHEERLPSIDTTDPPTVEVPEVQGVTASNDARYRKYFKMTLFGVPAEAVKIKMAAEGYDPDILNNPGKILPDGIQHEPAEE